MPNGRIFQLVAPLIALTASAAFAQPVVVTNSAGTFHWTTVPTAEFFVPGVVSFLNLTQPVSQSGATGPRIATLDSLPQPNTRGGWFEFEGVSAAVATNGTFSTGDTNKPLLSLAKVLHPGDTVDGSLAYGTEAYTRWLTDPSHLSQPDTDFFPTIGYIGVTLSMDDGLHYGWVEIQPVTPPTLTATGEYYVPVAWAYESTPNTAITIPAPEPASLALTAVALPMLLRRRR